MVLLRLMQLQRQRRAIAQPRPTYLFSAPFRLSSLCPGLRRELCRKPCRVWRPFLKDKSRRQSSRRSFRRRNDGEWICALKIVPINPEPYEGGPPLPRSHPRHVCGQQRTQYGIDNRNYDALSRLTALGAACLSLRSRGSLPALSSPNEPW